MADNVQVSENPIIAADDIGGVAYQRTKIVWGADGTATDASASAPLPVELVNGPTEDTAFADGDPGILPLAVRKDTAAASSTLSGDYEPLQTDSTGRLRTAATIIDDAGNDVTFSADAVIAPTTLTLATADVIAGDVMATGVLAFAAAVPFSGGSGHILNMSVTDLDGHGAAGDFVAHFYSGSVTPAAGAAVHSLSDADAAKYVGSIATTSGTWYAQATTTDTISISPAPPIPFKLITGVTLYAVLVAIDAPTRTSAGLGINLYIGGRS